MHYHQNELICPCYLFCNWRSLEEQGCYQINSITRYVITAINDAIDISFGSFDGDVSVVERPLKYLQRRTIFAIEQASFDTLYRRMMHGVILCQMIKHA